MANDPGKPDFSNVKSGSSSTAPAPAPKPDFGNVSSGVVSTAPVVEPPKEEPPTLQTYTVVKGDTLSKISRQFYGNANKWRRIFEANTDQLDNPDRIKPGQVLKIPPKS